MFKRFRVLLNGRNFKLVEDGVLQTLSFVTTRYVDASDANDAEGKAIATVFKDITCLNENDDPPLMSAMEVNQVHWLTFRLGKQGGYTFYAADKSEHEG